ncbi:MAG: MFS transporter [Actinomycetota bacterium]
MSGTDAVLAHASRRVLVGICLAVGGSFTVLASFNYVLTPMLADLGLTQSQASVALSIPPIASLLVVFLAGRLGDQRGHRTVMLWMSVAFIVGSLVVAIAQGLPAVVIGLLIEGIAATAIQIIGISLLSDRFRDPSARAAAFGTFGMVSPFVWLCLPVVTGWIVGEASWRWVPLMWAAFGLIMLVATLVLLPRPVQTSPIGELVTPILAGATVAAAVQWLNRVSDEGFAAPITLVSLGAAIALAGILYVLMRRLPSPTFSVAPLREGRARALLTVVIIIPFINTVFFMTMAFQYLYGLTVLQTALVMVPAQAAAVLGTKFIASHLMRRLGVAPTAMLLFAILSFAMLGVFAVTPTSPLWVPILYVTAYNLLTVAASITVTSAVLTSAPDVDSGQLSAYRGSAQSLGAVLAVVVMNAAVFTLGRLFMSSDLQANGLSQEDAESTMAQIQAAATSPDVMTQYAVPLPSGVETSQLMADSIATGLHINGVLGALLALACVFLVRGRRRD